jgi:two-component system, LytTR family, response regulator
VSATLGLLAIDDEAPARRTIKRLLAGDARFHWIGEAADGLAALDAIERLSPDVVVLDVHMPRASGLEVADALAELGRAGPIVVFSTAYEQHAIRAFETNAVDYLLKPYDAARFARALDRAFAAVELRRTGNDSSAPALAAFARSAHPPVARTTLTVRAEGGWRSLALADVIRLTAEGKHVAIVLRDRTTVVVRQSLTATIGRLDPGRFVRVHRGEVVNVTALERLEPCAHGDAIAVLRDGSSVVVSRTYRRDLLERLKR